MRQARQRRDRGFDHEVAGDIVEIGDQAEAAAVALECRVVEVFRFSLCHTCRRGAPGAPNHSANTLKWRCAPGAL